MRVTIKNQTDLVRDISSKAVINSNGEARKQILARRRDSLRQKEAINTLEEKVSNIESLLKEIIKRLS